jgi:hypothetical protein
MTVKFRLLAAAAGIATALAATSVLAGKNDYVFEPVAAEVKNGEGSQLAVRLIHKPSSKPVEGAIIFRSRLDMSPDAMGEMTAKVAAQPAKEPGVYRFKADITMAGRWALKLMAKVPGESETIEGTVVFKAR